MKYYQLLMKKLLGQNVLHPHVYLSKKFESRASQGKCLFTNPFGSN